MIKNMKVIIGLGNPGKEHEKTRHNARRTAAQYFAEARDFHAPGKEALLWKFDSKSTSHLSEGRCGRERMLVALPDTFMNKSGAAAGKLIRPKKELSDLIVLHDDLDLPLGKIKISYGKNSGGHKGVESIMRAVKTKNFIRIRIGVSGKKKPNDVLKFIVGKFKPEEEKIIKKELKKIDQALETICAESLEKAMSIYN